MAQYKNHIPLGDPRGSLDPSQPLPGEVPPARKRIFLLIGGGIALFFVGAIFGIFTHFTILIDILKIFRHLPHIFH